MRKAITLLMTMFIVSSCALEKSSDKIMNELEKTISKYFKAMQKQDKETMQALTPEPKIIPHESFTVTFIGALEPQPKEAGWIMEKGKKIEPIMEIYRESLLFAAQGSLRQAKKDQEELKYILKELKTQVEDLRAAIDITKDKKKRIDLAKKIEELENSMIENEDKLRKMNLTVLDLDKRVDSELKSIKLSLGITEKIDEYPIKEIECRAGVSLILKSRDKKELGLILKRYYLENSLGKTPETVEGKWVIGSISEIPAGELDSFASGVQRDIPSEDQSVAKLPEDMKPPKLINKVDPVYPEIAKGARVQGTVVLEVIIDIHGRIRDVKIIKSIPLLDQSAADAVRQWVYEPVILNGQPTPVRFSVSLPFSLD